MSNTSTNYAELNVTNDDMKEMLAEGNAPAAKTAPVKRRRNVGYRILAPILAIAPIIVFFLVNISFVISTTAGYAVYEGKLFDALKALFTNGLGEFYGSAAESVTGAVTSGFESFKVFGIPVLSGAGAVGKVMGLVLYILPAAMVLTVIMAVIGIFSRRAAPGAARAIAFVNFWAYGLYALCVLAVSLYYENIETAVDLTLLIAAGVFFLIYVVLAFIKAKKYTWMTLLMTILTAAFAGVLLYGIIGCADSLVALLSSQDAAIISSLTKGEFYRYVIIAVLGVALLGLAVSCMRMSTKKGYGFDIFRYIVHLIVVGVFIYFAFTEDSLKDIQLYAGIAAAIALVQVILCIVAVSMLKSNKAARAKEKEERIAEKEAEKAAIEAEKAEKKARKEAKKAEGAETVTETATTAETTVETEEKEEATGVYAEAVRYEGATQESAAREAEPLTAADLAGEQAAQPQQQPVYNYNFNTQPQEQPAGPGATADYDFYNSRSFDPFIASLSSAEREQFTEIFILKYKGDTKNLPDYQVGGDNTEFFRKVFIYLGQYRDRIPDSLLSKMYQFAIRK